MIALLGSLTKACIKVNTGSWVLFFFFSLFFNMFQFENFNTMIIYKISTISLKNAKNFANMFLNWGIKSFLFNKARFEGIND